MRDRDIFRSREILDVVVVFLADVGVGDFLLRFFEEHGVRVLAEGGELLSVGILGLLLDEILQGTTVFLEHFLEILAVIFRELLEFFLDLLGDEFRGGLESGLFGQLQHDVRLGQVFDLVGHFLSEDIFAVASVDLGGETFFDVKVDELLARDGLAVDRGKRIGQECEDLEDLGLGGGFHVEILHLRGLRGLGRLLGLGIGLPGGFFRLFVAACAEGRGGDASREAEREGFSREFHGVHIHSCSLGYCLLLYDCSMFRGPAAGSRRTGCPAVPFAKTDIYH